MKKIALPVTFSNQIDGHFGHCEMYSVYSISDANEISGINTINSEQGCGCKSNIAGTLAAQGVTVMLAGGIGNGAINVLNSHGIEVIRGCSGNATETVQKFLAGTLEDSGESCQQHEHHHGQEHLSSH
jgi:predicted Fe-Mo cluster-binding NifX family protein